MIAVVTCGHRPDDERVFHREIKTLLNAGYKVLYCTRWETGMDLSSENLIHYNYNSQSTTIKQYQHRLIEKLLSADDITILHIHEFEMLPLAKRLKKDGQIKIIYDVHDTLKAMWDTFSSKKGLLKKWTNHALSVYEAMYLQYVDEVILANRIIGDNRYSKLGLPTMVIENFPSKNNIHTKEKITESPLILYQGQISRDRGSDLLLTAFEIVKKKYPDVRLRLLGASRTKDFAIQLKNMINMSQQKNQIEWLGNVPHADVWSHMQEAHIGVIPSIATPRVMVDTPTKLFEYMASGCGIVATDVPPVRYYLAGKGELVMPNVANALANGILKLLDDQKLLSDYTEQCKTMIFTEYNWEKTADKLLRIYTRLSP